jgi:hypothetical protein
MHCKITLKRVCSGSTFGYAVRRAHVYQKSVRGGSVLFKGINAAYLST